MMLSFTDNSFNVYKASYWAPTATCYVVCFLCVLCLISDDDCKDIDEGSLCLQYFPRRGFHEMFLLVKLWIFFYSMCA